MSNTEDLGERPRNYSSQNRLEEKVDALVAAVNRLVLFEERQAVQALAIVENTKISERIVIRMTDVESRLLHRIEAGEVKLAMWINRGIGVWALAATLFTVYKALVR